MGKSLNGKELGKGISQRKDGLYQARFVNTCKKNCRSSTKETYASHYRKIQKELGWIKLTNLNLIVLQQVFNELRSDNERKNSKKILADMLEKSIDAELLIKNVAKQVNIKVSKDRRFRNWKSS